MHNSEQSIKYGTGTVLQCTGTFSAVPCGATMKYGAILNNPWNTVQFWTFPAALYGATVAICMVQCLTIHKSFVPTRGTKLHTGTGNYHLFLQLCKHPKCLLENMWGETLSVAELFHLPSEPLDGPGEAVVGVLLAARVAPARRVHRRLLYRVAAVAAVAAAAADEGPFEGTREGRCVHNSAGHSLSEQDCLV